MPPKSKSEKYSIRQLENKYLDRLTIQHIDAAIIEFDTTPDAKFYKLAKSGPSQSDFIERHGNYYPMKAIIKRAMQISEGRDDLEFDHTTQGHRPYLKKLELNHHLKTLAGYCSQEHKKEKWSRIRQRPFQANFRKAVLEKYNSMCCFSGITTANAIDAAHLEGWKEDDNNETGNGLPMRADLHRLFDTGLLSIDPDTHTIHLHNCLILDYGKFQGTPLQYKLDLSDVGAAAIHERWTNKI